MAAAARPPHSCDALPPVIIGCWQLLERVRDPQQAIATLMAYAEAGFTAFDTADIYGPSEKILGAFRQQYTATHGESKGRELRFHSKYVTGDDSQENAIAVNTRSLSALGVDKLDLVAFHWWDFHEGDFIQGALALKHLQGHGKIQAIGVTNFDVAHAKQLIDAGVDLASNQVQYSMLDRRPENGLLDFAQANHMALHTYGSVAGGFLSDKFLAADEPRGRLGTASLNMYKRSLDEWSGGDWGLFQELLRVLRAVGDRHDGAPISAVAMRWVQSKLDASCGGRVIMGVRDATHLADTIAMSKVTLNEADMQEIATVLDKGIPPRGDVYSAERGQ